MRANSLIVLIPSSGLAGPVRLPACKRGLCWQPATNFAQHTVLLCAQARVVLALQRGWSRPVFVPLHPHCKSYQHAERKSACDIAWVMDPSEYACPRHDEAGE